MFNSKKLFFFLLNLFFHQSVFAFEVTEVTMDCKFTQSSIAVSKPIGTPFVHTNEPDSSSITITNLNTKEPMLIGNGGTSPLSKIENDNAIYFIEKTDFGNLVLYTYVKDSKQIIFSKQYVLDNSVQKMPYAHISTGTCTFRK